MECVIETKANMIVRCIDGLRGAVSSLICTRDRTVGAYQDYVCLVGSLALRTATSVSGAHHKFTPSFA